MLVTYWISLFLCLHVTLFGWQVILTWSQGHVWKEEPFIGFTFSGSVLHKCAATLACLYFHLIVSFLIFDFMRNHILATLPSVQTSRKQRKWLILSCYLSQLWTYFLDKGDIQPRLLIWFLLHCPVGQYLSIYECVGIRGMEIKPCFYKSISCHTINKVHNILFKY